MKTFSAIAVGVLVLVLAGCGAGSNKAAQRSAAKDNYPMDTCVVTGAKLGSMGDPYVIKYQGKTIKFCCSSCIKDFNADTAKYVAIFDEAAKVK